MFRYCIFNVFVTSLLLSSLAFSHGDEEHLPPDQPTEERSIEEEFFEDVIIPIVQMNCQGCHNINSPSGGHSFELSEEIKSHASLIFDAVEKSRMPLGFPAWRENIDAKTLLFWASQEIKKDSEDFSHEVLTSP